MKKFMLIPGSGYTNILSSGHIPDHIHQETDAENKDVPKCASETEPPLRPELYQDADTEKNPPCIGEGQTERLKTCLDDSQDISQISGPNGKSSFTPLSQIGFRDTASVGCGQQLTLLSIEVLEIVLPLSLLSKFLPNF